MFVPSSLPPQAQELYPRLVPLDKKQYQIISEADKIFLHIKYLYEFT